METGPRASGSQQQVKTLAFMKKIDVPPSGRARRGPAEGAQRPNEGRRAPRQGHWRGSCQGSRRHQCLPGTDTCAGLRHLSCRQSDDPVIFAIAAANWSVIGFRWFCQCTLWGGVYGTTAPPAATAAATPATAVVSTAATADVAAARARRRAAWTALPNCCAKPGVFAAPKLGAVGAERYRVTCWHYRGCPSRRHGRWEA